MRAGKWFYKAPVQTICRLEFHPVGHRIACSRTALPTTIRHLQINRVVAMRRRVGDRAYGHRCGEKHVIPFDHIQPLRSVLSLSFTAEGFLGCCTGGSKERNEFWFGETTAQALSQTASPTAMAARSRRDTFIQFENVVNRAACVPPVQKA